MFERQIEKEVKKQMAAMCEKWIEYERDRIQTHLKEQAKHSLVELLMDPDDSHFECNNYWTEKEVSTIGGALKKRMVEATAASFDRLYIEKAQEYIEGELFIDQIVERIRRKQLDSGRG